MHFEELEQRTLFAGANETIEADLAIAAPVVLEAEFFGDVPGSEFNVIAGQVIESSIEACEFAARLGGEMKEATVEFVDAYMVGAYDAVADKAQDYYDNPTHLAGDALYATGKSLEYLGAVAEYVGQSMDGLGEGLGDYANAVYRAGRWTFLASAAITYQYDPSLSTLYAGTVVGGVISGAGLVMPHVGTVSSFVGSAVETLGSYAGSLGSFTADYGSSLTA